MVWQWYGVVAADGATKLDPPSVNICQDTKSIGVWREALPIIHHATFRYASPLPSVILK